VLVTKTSGFSGQRHGNGHGEAEKDTDIGMDMETAL
jgi:hypothetical protein